MGIGFGSWVPITVLAAIFSGYTVYIIQGQIGVLPSQFKNIKAGQQVTTTVTRYKYFNFVLNVDIILWSICSDKYRDIPIVMVTEAVTLSTNQAVSMKSISSTKQVKEGDILSVV